MIYLINYADENYKKAQNLNTLTAKYIGKFKKIIEYSPVMIDEDFANKNKEIISIARGNGLWLWKPYFVKKTMMKMNDGDILFYLDSGAFFIRNKKYILKTLNNNDIWISDIPLIEKQFTKEDTFRFMDCIDESYKETNQIQATFFAIKKNQFTMKFVDEWLTYCCDKKILNGNVCIFENDESFIAHREDQSILSLLCKKYHIEPKMDPTQYGKICLKFKQNGYIYKPVEHKKEYPISILLHRQAIPKNIYILRCLLNIILPANFVNKIVKHQ